MSQPDSKPISDDGDISLVGWTVRVLIALVVIGIGAAGFAKLKSLRRKPPTREFEEAVRDVFAHQVEAKAEQVVLSGYGTVRSRRIAQISPEVSGVVLNIYADLNDGAIVDKGTVLCRIDNRELKITRQVHEAEKERFDAEIKVLEQQTANARKLLVLRKEAAVLDENEYKRVSNLLTESKIGSRTVVDRSRQMWIRSREAVTALENSLAQIPLQVKTLRTQQKRVAAQLALADLNLSRCEVKAPFRGRLQRPTVEAGQTVARGQPILALVDDSDREIEVSLDGGDAARWLAFSGGTPDAGDGWFRKLKPVVVDVRWLEQPEAHKWQGTLSRIASYDERTRTVHAVVTIEATKSAAPLALVPGMFCEVQIPGATIPDAMRFPRSAVSADGHVFVVEKGRLASRSFVALRHDGEDVLAHVSRSGAKVPSLQSGDQVVTTKLSSPVDGMQVRVIAGKGMSPEKPRK